MVILRRVVGEQLRRLRQDQGRTLRDVSSAARVSLAAICTALDVPLSSLLRSVSDEVASAEAAEAAVVRAA
jgi:DNA-binding Xre family transcriptional regulator